MLASLRSWFVVFLPALSLRHYNTHEFLNTRTRQASCLSGSLAKRRDSTTCRARSKLQQVRRVLIDRVLRFFLQGATGVSIRTSRSPYAVRIYFLRWIENDHKIKCAQEHGIVTFVMLSKSSHDASWLLKWNGNAVKQRGVQTFACRFRSSFFFSSK